VCSNIGEGEILSLTGKGRERRMGFLERGSEPRSTSYGVWGALELPSGVRSRTPENWNLVKHETAKFITEIPYYVRIPGSIERLKLSVGGKILSPQCFIGGEGGNRPRRLFLPGIDAT